MGRGDRRGCARGGTGRRRLSDTHGRPVAGTRLSVAVIADTPAAVHRDDTPTLSAGSTWDELAAPDYAKGPAGVARRPWPVP